MWGLGPPNKRIRVTNAMLANSRRWRGGLRRRAQKESRFQLFLVLIGYTLQYTFHLHFCRN